MFLNFHNLSSVFGRKHSKPLQQKEAMSQTMQWTSQFIARTPVRTDDGTRRADLALKICKLWRRWGRQAPCDKTPLPQSPHENELCADLYSLAIL